MAPVSADRDVERRAELRVKLSSGPCVGMKRDVINDVKGMIAICDLRRGRGEL